MSILDGATSDAAGNLSTASSSQDNTVTVIRTPPATTATTTYAINAGTAQTYTMPFSLTPEGTYTITFASIDPLGNQEATQSITVTVDGTAPVIRPIASQTLDPTSPSGTPGIFSTAITDNLTPNNQIAVSCIDQHGDPFVSGQIAPIGTTTTITCTATDLAGNSANVSFSFTVASMADLFTGLRTQIDSTDINPAQQRLLLKLSNTAEWLATWSPRMSCVQLLFMDRYIRSQEDVHRISTSDAALLYEQTAKLWTALGCNNQTS